MRDIRLDPQLAKKKAMEMNGEELAEVIAAAVDAADPVGRLEENLEHIIIEALKAAHSK